MFFDDMKKAATFINNNGDRIDNWWKSKNLQKARKEFLKEHYEVSDDSHQNMKNLIDQELKIIKYDNNNDKN